jgi:NAD(P)-dependent dehydrogenase (short-subunit alcohol dehydrogenase family)
VKRGAHAGFEGSLAVVTGAGRGIGRETALALSRAGATVVLVSRTADELECVRQAIHADGGRADVLPLDVRDPEAVRDRLGALEQIDVLVNSAGVNIPGKFLEASDNDAETILATNVKGTFFASQVAAERMLARGNGGAIVNLSSQMGRVGYPGRALYCASKHAVEGLTKAMALELAPAGIRVNAVAPTFVETPLTEHFLADADFTREILSRIPLGRIGTVSEVAAAIVFLASPAASLITGTSLAVDGGWTAI